MSGLINIGGDQNDASYRYKMPRVQTKVEGRGNGIKTVIPNMVEMAKALHVPPAYPTKFFGIELGAQSKFNKKDERAIVNGAHMTADMQKLMMNYIQIFVLCPTCGLPELNMEVKKSSIKIDCAACGHNAPLQTAHKLTTYILKNPPKGKKGNKKGGKKGTKQERRALKNNSKENKAGSNGASDDVPEEEEQEWFTDTSKTAQKQRMEEEFAEMNENSGVSPEVEAILEAAKAENKENAPVTVLKIFLAKGERANVDVISELRRLQLARGLDDPQRLKVLLEALIDPTEVKTVHQQFAKKAVLLAHYAQDRNQATTLINCLEELCGVVHPQLMVRVPHILQALYETDVLDEEVLLGWYESPPESSWLVNKDIATEVRERALPLITWLREAESDEDDSGDDE